MDASPPVTPYQTQTFFGWKVVGAAFVVAVFGWGIGFYGPPIYLKAVQDARGWSVALVSAAVTLHFLAGALVVANLPRLHARFGLPATTLGGAALAAVGVLGWAVVRQPWQLFAATLLSGAGWVALGAAGINAMVSPWFVRRRPAALSMAYNGASIGGVIFSPLWVGLIGAIGFARAAMLVGCAMMLVVGALAFTLLNRTPAAMGLLPDGDAAIAPVGSGAAAAPAPIRNPWSDPAFVTLAGGMALGLFAQIGLIAHLFSLLVPALGAQGAGLAAGMATAAAILGRTLVGWLMPPGADRRVVAALNYAVQASGCAALLLADGASVPLLLLGTALIGLGIGNATSLPPLIAQVEFAKHDVPRVVAMVTATAQATYAFAPAAFGLLRELAGQSSGAAPELFITAAAIQAIAAGAYLAGRARFTAR
jgi:MFS family permease